MTTMRRLAILAVFAVVATLAASAASAQPAPQPAQQPVPPSGPQPESDARTLAAAHVRQGQAFFQRGDFDRALAEYRTALDLSAEPSLIFNVALCHDRANRPEEALKAFQHYLELAPNGSVAEEARGDIARLTPIVEKIVADRDAEQARQREAAARRADADHQAEVALRTTAARNRRARLARLVLVGGGMVVGAGAVTHFVAHQHVDRVASDKDPAHYLDDRNTLLVERDVAYGAYAVGGAALAAGLILAFTARGADDGPRVSAAIIPGGATLGVAWSR
jgi:tetratricopeptide (TPR) repeat protein